MVDLFFYGMEVHISGIVEKRAAKTSIDDEEHTKTRVLPISYIQYHHSGHMRNRWDVIYGCNSQMDFPSGILLVYCNQSDRRLL